jgi:hypothetical protein
VNDEPRRSSGGPVSGLGEILALGLEAVGEWRPEELAAVLREHMAAPVEFELAAFQGPAREALRAHATAQGLVLANLADLLRHPNPPIELLVMAKDFFKANCVRPNPGLPVQVAKALYFATVAAAWLRHHTRISALGDAELRAGLDWVQRQPWTGEDLRALVDRAAADLKVSPEPPKP